jgi:CHAT domain-containing protein
MNPSRRLPISSLNYHKSSAVYECATYGYNISELSVGCRAWTSGAISFSLPEERQGMNSAMHSGSALLSRAGIFIVLWPILSAAHLNLPDSVTFADTPVTAQEKLDPKTDTLTRNYIPAELVGKYGYLEVEYPQSFKADGRGSLKTKPLVQSQSQTVPDNVRDWISEVTPTLESNPRDKEVLGEIVRVLGNDVLCTRIVPFADRFIAVGGVLGYDATQAYVGGLARLGRTPEALKQYKAAVQRWGSMSENIAATLFGDRFRYSWLVENNFKEMLASLEQGMHECFFPGDSNYIQETFCDLLRQAGERQELPWFSSRMEQHWMWLNETFLKRAIETFVANGLTPPESLVAASDPMLKGAVVPPEALYWRAIDSSNRGESEKASQQAERAVALSKGSTPRKHFMALKIFARILRQRQDLERAYEITAEAERVAGGMKEAPDMGWALVMNGFLMEKLADFRRAADFHAEAYRIGESIDYRELSHTAKSSVARALSQTGMAAQVEPTLRAVALDATKRRLFTQIPVEYSNWGTCLNQLGRHEAALAAFQQALAPVKEVGSGYSIELATHLACLKGIAYALLALKQYDEAEKAYDRYATLASKALTTPSAWVWQLGKARCRWGIKDKAAAQKWIDECLKSIDAERASLKDFQHRRTLNDNKYEAYELAILLALDRGETELAFGIAERSRARAFLDEMGAYSVNLHPPTPVDLAQLVKSCSDACAVVYYQLPDRLLAWVVADGKAEMVTMDVAEPKVQGLVQGFMSGIYLQSKLLKDQSRDRVERSDAVQASKALQLAIWAPVATKLPEGQRVCIIPHRALHYVPFQALHDGAKFLIESREIVTAPSASAIVELRERKMEVGGATLVFDPILSEDPQSPFAKTESLDLKTQYPEGKFILKRDATLAAFRENAKDARIIHVSSHGSYNPWVPLESGLVFLDANGKPGLLSSREVYTLKLNRTELIVMSACVSSVGDFAKGDEVTGLTRAFQVAGVPNVIGSLWPVENDATIELMTAFHKSLAETKHPATALQQAQVKMIAKNAVIARWAPFELTGSGRALQQ